MISRVACCIRFSEYVAFMSATTLEIAMTEFIANSIQTIFSSLFLNVFAQLMRKICQWLLVYIVQVTHVSWDLPKPSNYSHDVFQSYYGYIACLGVIINLF